MCIILICLTSTSFLDIFVVQRVHWLQARGQKEQWNEEVILVRHEMEWTVQYFLHNRDVWEEQRKSSLHPGPALYAAHKASMWNYMALDANQTFSQQNSMYKRLL